MLAVEAAVHLVVLVELVVRVAVQMARIQALRLLLQPQTLEAAAAVAVNLVEAKLMAPQVALASSSSRSINKDLWKPKSTDFSA